MNRDKVESEKQNNNWEWNLRCLWELGESIWKRKYMHEINSIEYHYKNPFHKNSNDLLEKEKREIHILSMYSNPLYTRLYIWIVNERDTPLFSMMISSFGSPVERMWNQYNNNGNQCVVRCTVHTKSVSKFNVYVTVIHKFYTCIAMLCVALCYAMPESRAPMIKYYIPHILQGLYGAMAMELCIQWIYGR